MPGKTFSRSRRTLDVAPGMTRQTATGTGQNPMLGLAGLVLLQLLGGGGLGGLLGLPGQGGASEEAGHGAGMGHFGGGRETRSTGHVSNNHAFIQQNLNNDQPNSFGSFLKNAPIFNNNNIDKNNLNNNNQNQNNNGGRFPPTFSRSHERRPNFSNFAAGLSSNAGIMMAPQRFPDPKFLPQSSNLSTNRNFVSANPQLTLSFQPAKQNNGGHQPGIGCMAKDSGVPIFG
ncbi:hypothetical protein RvY_07282 [Ramazzottius varieornatus]|uniref:Uncharacterized protein n=1 Tax=Ramazzottius varieornatus TaxID=947166 RepID=A0A1D1V1J5_RAMVA|nr:hypothetical protein RvY_07282 [Ramazzottius varieornatus]